MSKTSNISITHDSQEWSSDFEGKINAIEVDGNRLNDIHDLAIKVEGIAQSIKTLVLCLGAVVLICLVCNIGIATWVATHNDEITDVIDSTISRNSKTMDAMGKLNNIYVRKLESLGLVYRDGKWHQLNNTYPNPSE